MKLLARFASLGGSFVGESRLGVGLLMRKILNELWMSTCRESRSERCLSTLSRSSFGM